MLSQIPDETVVRPASDMMQELLTDSEKMCEMFKVVYNLADNQHEYGLSNFYAERQDAHRKHSWMLKSVLK